MQLRSRLTILFTVVVSLILFVCFLSIYILSGIYRQHEFYTRLSDKAYTTAELLIRVDQIDSSMLKIIDKTNKDILYGESISIFDHSNTELYTNNDTIRFDNSKELLSEIRKKKSIQFRRGEFEGIGLEINDDSGQYEVIAAAVDKYGISKHKNLRNTLIVMYFVVMLIIGIAGWLYAGRALQPISQITDEVNAIFPTDLSKRVSRQNNKDEVSRLASTFNRLLERIENAFKAQKNFVANVSHELKNPLTAITSQLEVASIKDRTPEEYRKTIASVLEDIKELNETSNQLLDLARLNSDRFDLPFTDVRIDEITWQAKDALRRVHPDYRVEFSDYELPEDERLLVIRGNESLLRTAFVNLMENACKFSDNQVDIKLSASGSLIYLTFSDKGVGISPEDLPYLFDPFYRSKHLPQKKGHGIGLSIVKRILELHGAEIEILSQPGKGSDFILKFERKKTD